jgi:hypothetical protein
MQIRVTLTSVLRRCMLLSVLYSALFATLTCQKQHKIGGSRFHRCMLLSMLYTALETVHKIIGKQASNLP